jgi:catechol 2,3-dioxygenase-like lactoylglutathione lyase family enzyme
MLEQSRTFSGISVDDLEEARRFYGGVLGFPLHDEVGGFSVDLPGGARLWGYDKPNHEPATFTVLDFVVPDIDAAVDELNAAGVRTKIYPDEQFPTDEKGIARGRAVNRGPDIAWFTDPAGNVLAVLQPDDAGPAQ